MLSSKNEATPTVATVLFADILIFNLFQVVTNGMGSIGQDLALPKNAVVEAFPVTLRAGRMEWARAARIAKVRPAGEASPGAGSKAFVVDFGMPRTVSGVALLDVPGVTLTRVRSWSGTAFTLELSNGTGVFGAPPRALFEERLTQRVEVQVAVSAAASSLSLDALGEAIAVHVPSDPADFELRINNGPPVWSFAGSVVHGPGAWQAPSTDGFSSLVVDIGAALTRLCGDPLARRDPTQAGDREHFQLSFTARTPGALALGLPEPAAQKIGYVQRVTAGFENQQRGLSFEEEGQQEVELEVPAWAKRATSIAFKTTAKLGPERVLPPVGPETLELADLSLDATRTAAVRLPPLDGLRLAELVALRLPLRAGPGGAEAKVLLLGDGEQPGEPLPGAVSAAVVIDSATEAWFTFPFSNAIKLGVGQGARPWVALLPSRGQLFWSLSAGSVRGETRRGPPSGPWSILPQVDDLALARARLRRVGRAAPTAPIAPLVWEILGDPASVPPRIEVTPTTKGVLSELRFDTGVPVTEKTDGRHIVRLRVTSRVTGSLTLSEVDLTLTT